jgi:hypothetical protein
MSEKLRELVAKWRREAAIVDRNHGKRLSFQRRLEGEALRRCADELEAAALAEKQGVGEGPARVTADHMRKFIHGRFTQYDHDWEAVAEQFNTLLAAEKPAERPTEMYLCEVDHLILHPDQLYRFSVHPDCIGCASYVSGPAERPQLSAEQVIQALNATGCESGDFAPDCGSHSSTWVKRFTVSLNALLTGEAERVHK